MKQGDEIAVSMEGFHVANAVIEEVSNGEAIIYIPATRLVMGVAESLVEKPNEGTKQLLTDHPLEGPESAAPNLPVEPPAIWGGVVAPANTPEPSEGNVEPPSPTVARAIATGAIATDNYVPLDQQKLDSSAID